MHLMMEVMVMENPLSTAVSVLPVERSVITVSVGALWDCYEMSCTFTVCEWFFCVQLLCGMYENILNCDWLKERLALPVSLIGSWCHSRTWSVSESERLVCAAKLLIRQQVVQVILPDLSSASALLTMLGVHLCILSIWWYCCCSVFPLVMLTFILYNKAYVMSEVTKRFCILNVWQHKAV